MNIHLLSCFVLKMDTNLSLSFFFTDYARNPSIRHA